MSIRRHRCTLIATGLVLALAGTGQADDVPLPGKKLAAKKKLVWIAKSSLSLLPGDPTDDDAQLTIYNPSTLEAATIALPAAGWKANKSFTKIKFKGKQVGSAAKLVSLTQKKGIKVKLAGAGITLDEPAQGALGIELGFFGRRLRYCSLFGGTVKKDQQGKFIAKNASAPGSCPTPDFCGNGTIELGEECEEGTVACSGTDACINCRCVGTGDVSVSLLWENENDLDLHVIEPSGQEIFWDERTSATSGTLDDDANGGCRDATVAPIENIYWPTGTAPMGTYTVLVNYYDQCQTGTSTPFTVVTVVDGVQSEYQGVATVPDDSCGMCGSPCACEQVIQFTR